MALINTFHNLRRTKMGSFLWDAGLSALAIYGFIHLQSIPYETVEITKIIPSAEVTTEKGLYINNYLLPLEKLTPGKVYSLPFPYSRLGGDEQLSLFVDDPGITLEVKPETGFFRRAKAALDPLASGRDGKDGLVMRSRTLDQYLVRIWMKGPHGPKEYLLKFRYGFPALEEQEKVPITRGGEELGP